MNADGRRWTGRMGIAVVLFAMAGAFAPLARAATEIPPGKWSFVFVDKKGHPERPIRVYTYRPRACDTTCPIQIVMHAETRTASVARDEWELLADRFGLLVVVPEFTDKYWEGREAYSLGDVANQVDPAKWSYSAVEHLFDEVRDGQKTYNLYGHAAGAQFVQRLLLMLPDNRSGMAAVANAGWYLMPEWRGDKIPTKYPYSLVGAKVGEDALRKAFTRRLVIVLGEADTDPAHPDLDKSDGAMKQGANRLERGENFFMAANRAAHDLNVKLAWELVQVPKVGHDSGKMARAAAIELYKATGK
jgi:poly(3-hydroxybutyrate) depolymerase